MIKKFSYVVLFCLLTQFAFAAGDSSSDSSSDNYLDQYKAAKSLIKRGKNMPSNYFLSNYFSSNY